MDWIKLKQKFPNSYDEIREHYVEKGLKGRFLINDFLVLKGYDVGFTFIRSLKDYEKQCKGKI
tara:strand:+ start:2313 stop:2501 length:189 start_codon:yes stop_codon:yes gene_type:complete